MKLFSGCMKTHFACTITLTLTKIGQQAVDYGLRVMGEREDSLGCTITLTMTN